MKNQASKINENLKKPEIQNYLKTLLFAALIKKAANGDTKAFEVIRDTIGEKPTDKQEITSDIKTSNPVINILPVRAN